MAKKIANQETVEKLWNFKIFFPKDNYVIRVLSQDNKPSQSGKPMTKLEFEIVNCEPRQIGNEGIIAFDGVTFNKYYLTGDPTDAKADDRWFAAFDTILKKAGIDTSEGWEQENPPSIVGKVFQAALFGKPQTQRADPTEEEKKSSDPEIRKGKIMIDPTTNKPAITYQIEIGEIYCQFTGEVRPF